MSKEKQQMPMTTAGLTRYFDESPEAIKIKPEHVVGIVAAIIILEIFLHMFL